MRFRFAGIVLIAFAAILFPRFGERTNASNQTIYTELKPQHILAVAFGTSRKVSDFGPATPGEGTTSKSPAQVKALEIPNRERFRKEIADLLPDAETPVGSFSTIPMPPVGQSFSGLSSADNFAAYGQRFLPPDTIGDVGFNHYVQAVNLLVRVYDKSGNPLTPPFKLSSLFEPLGTPCSTRNDGDPNVVFDPLANRWILSQFCTAFPPFRQMVAISKTGDPTGEYYIYEFVMPNVKLNDYPKFGVWRDSYLMSTDEFLGSDYAGSGVFAFDRWKMLNGDPSAGYIYFDLASPSTIRLGGLLPADLDGLRAPPAGAPALFVGYSATEYGEGIDALRLFELRPDFADPFASTFSESAGSPVAVSSFDPTSPNGRDDIAQPPPGEKLDSQSDRLMFRIAYRNFGSFESLVFNQTVRTSPSDQTYRAGVRVHELRRNGVTEPFSVAQSATIGDSLTSRFMGAAAQDGQGNLAVSYSTSNEKKQPAIIYSGRLASESPGEFRMEGTLVAGSGVQKAFGFRWGDYSGMSVDPQDDCTFWVTNQYYTLESQNESDFGWLTRIGTFRFAECTDPAMARISGSVVNAANSQPIAGAVVTVESVYSRSTNAAGLYESISLPSQPNVTITASAPGFRSVSRTIPIAGSGPFVENFALDPVPIVDNAVISITGETCAVNNIVEPGERVTLDVNLRNSGSIPASNLTVSLEQSGGAIDPSGPQNYGALPIGGAGVTRPFSFTASPALDCGEAIVLTFRLIDNGIDIGSTSVTVPTGRKRLAFSENFDSITVPGLPPGWTSSATGAQQPWSTSTTRNQTVPNSAFSPEPNQVGLNDLTTPEIAISSAGAEIEFRNWYELETTFLRNRLYDGAVLEIKIGATDWQDIEAAGGRFLSGGYDGVIDSCCSNPLAGRRGWSGRSGPNQASEFVTARAKLPASAAGNLVRFRWRVGTDIGGVRTGQFIDNLVITDGFVCDCAVPTYRAPFDFDGDGKTDISVFRPSDVPDAPDFFIRSSFSGASANRSWGSTGDVPVNSDYDGDGKTDLAVFRPSSRTWFVLRSSDSAIIALNFGLAGDLHTPSDFDGDGRADIAVFRPSDGNWYVLKSSDASVAIDKFGLVGDLPVPADFDGDGKSDRAVFRPSDGNWYILQSASGTARIEKFGLAGDKPVTGDFTGDGRSELTIFRPSTGVWYQSLSSGQLKIVNFGLPGDLPLQIDFDGDSLRDIGVYRPASGTWFVIGSSSGTSVVAFGSPGDIAVPAIFSR